MLQMRRQALSKKTAQRFSFSTSSAYEQVTAGADVEQLEFMKEMIIQVDEQDNVIGPITKKDSHFHQGVLHRAFSVFLFNSKNELLIQKRAKKKITFPSYWANTCCSHPLFIKEEMEENNNIGIKKAAIRKLEHELGINKQHFQVADLKYATTVLYKAASDSNWSEYEVDHVLLVKKDVELHVNPNEVEAIEYVSKDQLAFLLLNDQNRHFSPWFHLIGANLLPKWWNSLEFFLEKDQQDQTIHDYR